MSRWDEQEIVHRKACADQHRAAILPYIRDTVDLVMPWRSDRLKGGTGFERLFDSSGPMGVQRASSKLQRDFTPPFQRWFELEAGALVPGNSVEEVNRSLEVPTAISHAVLDASSFHKASHEAYGDLQVSTGALLGTEGDDRDIIRWSAAPAWSLSFEEGPSGRVDNVFWDKTFPAWMLDRHWKGAAWPEAIRNARLADPTRQVGVVQTSYYDLDLDRWRIAVMCKEGDRRHIVWESDRDRTNPWVIFRYWTTPGDPWGRGPAMLALPDIRTANKTVEMILKAAAYQLAPPLMVTHDGVVNPDNLRLAPQALIRVARTGGPMGRSIEPLNVGGNVDLGQMVLEDMRQGIARNLNSSQLPQQTGAVRSASEIIERAKELQYDSGAAFGRLNHEFVPQVVARVLDILDRKKVALIKWDELKIDQMILRVKVTSPLARAQNLEDVQTIVQFWELAKTIGGEEAFLHIANTEDGLPRLAKLMGVPMWAVNDAERRDQLAKAAGDMAANVMASNQGGPAPATPFANLTLAA